MAGGNQVFKYDMKTHQITSLAKNLCFEGDLSEKILKLFECNSSSEHQRWKFNDFMNQTAISDWKNYGRPFEDENSIYW